MEQKEFIVKETGAVSENIGQIIKDILHEKKLKQTTFSKIIHKSPARVSQITKGTCGLTIESLLKILSNLRYEIIIREKKETIPDISDLNSDQVELLKKVLSGNDEEFNSKRIEEVREIFEEKGRRKY